MSKNIRQQNSYTILVIGDACIDSYYFGSCDRLSPEAPVPIFKKEKLESRQGMCLNVASNLKSLGHNVNIDKNTETIRKIRLVDKKTNQHVLRIDEEPSVKRIDLRRYTKNSMRDFDALVISDYDKGFIDQGDILDIIEPSKIRGIPIFVDSKKKDLSKFEDCIIKINKQEKDTVTLLPEKCDLIVTLGKDGALYNNHVYPVSSTIIHDVCGAGDVFLAGLVHQYLLSKGDIPSSIEFANRCASISVSHFGTYVIKKDDLL